MAKTNGQRTLKRLDVPFETGEYEHKVKGAQYAAEALGWPVESMIKTLVVHLEGEGLVFALLPGHLELSLKKLARAAGVKSARMSTQPEAERTTGYQLGGIGPFGSRKPLPVWMHDTLTGFDRVGINGGKRGVIVFIPPDAITGHLKARTADLAT